MRFARLLEKLKRTINGANSCGQRRGRWDRRRRLFLERLETRTLPSFAAPLSFDAGDSPVSVAVADVNDDGRPDLAVANSSGTVSVLLGNGDGSFQAALHFLAGRRPSAMAVLDVNGDGRPDLAVTNFYNGVRVLLGNGDGTFQTTHVSFAAGSRPFSVAAADLNGDGRTDLAIANHGSDDVSVLLNVPPPAVQSVVVNDGSAQRSRVTGLTVTFTGPVTLDPTAFELRRQDGSLVELSVAISVLDGRTMAVLSFPGPDLVAGSLADGNYTLTIRADRVRDACGQQLAGDQVEAFFRLYGDTDGDRDVDHDDVRFLVRTFGRARGTRSSYRTLI